MAELVSLCRWLSLSLYVDGWARLFMWMAELVSSWMAELVSSCGWLSLSLNGWLRASLYVDGWARLLMDG
jgi:hypothetical protein